MFDGTGKAINSGIRGILLNKSSYFPFLVSSASYIIILIMVTVLFAFGIYEKKPNRVERSMIVESVKSSISE